METSGGWVQPQGSDSWAEGGGEKDPWVRANESVHKPEPPKAPPTGLEKATAASATSPAQEEGYWGTQHLRSRRGTRGGQNAQGNEGGSLSNDPVPKAQAQGKSQAKAKPQAKQQARGGRPEKGGEKGEGKGGEKAKTRPTWESRVPHFFQWLFKLMQPQDVLRFQLHPQGEIPEGRPSPGWAHGEQPGGGPGCGPGSP